VNVYFSTRERKCFFKIGDPQKENLCEAFHPNLGNIYPEYFYMMQLELYVSCLLVMPKEENYHRLFNHLSVAFDQLLAMVASNCHELP